MQAERPMQDLEDAQQNFNTFVEFFQKTRLNQGAIRRAMKKYQIKNMKVNDVTPLRARRMFNAIKNKYENGMAAESNWFQNQRRIFIWVLLCYLHKQGIDIGDMKLQHFQFLHSIFPRKELELIKFQSFSIIKKSSRNQTWIPIQDQILTQIIQKNQFDDSSIEWSTISRQFFNKTNEQYFRNAKQCRQRWLNHLDPTKTKGKWELNQDKIILTQVLNHGKKWSKIAHLLENKKNQHMVKNRFKSLMHKMEKRLGTKKMKQNKIIQILLQEIQNQLQDNDLPNISDIKNKVQSSIPEKQNQYSVSNEDDDNDEQIIQKPLVKKQKEVKQEADQQTQKTKSLRRIVEVKKIIQNVEVSQTNEKQNNLFLNQKNQKIGEEPQKAMELQNEIELIGDGQIDNNNDFLERIVQSANTPTADNRFPYMFDARSPSFILSPFQPGGNWTPTIFFMQDPQGQISPQVGFGNFSSKYMNDLSKFVGGDQTGDKKK